MYPAAGKGVHKVLKEATSHPVQGYGSSCGPLILVGKGLPRLQQIPEHIQQMDNLLIFLLHAFLTLQYYKLQNPCSSHHPIQTNTCTKHSFPRKAPYRTATLGFSSPTKALISTFLCSAAPTILGCSASWHCTGCTWAALHEVTVPSSCSCRATPACCTQHTQNCSALQIKILLVLSVLDINARQGG